MYKCLDCKDSEEFIEIRDYSCLAMLDIKKEEMMVDVECGPTEHSEYFNEGRPYFNEELMGKIFYEILKVICRKCKSENISEVIMADGEVLSEANPVGKRVDKIGKNISFINLAGK